MSVVILAPVVPEAPEALRLFSTPVKVNSSGAVISGQTGDLVKTLVGAEAAGVRAGLQRFTKIMFGAQYDTGRPNASHRVDLVFNAAGTPLGGRPVVLHAPAMKHARAFHPLDPRAARTRLILATAVALVAWIIVPENISASTRALLACDSGGLVLLGVALLIITRSDAAETRRRAAAYDPGRRLVWVIVLAGSAFSLFAAAALLRHGHGGTPLLRGLHVGLCIATVAISWLITTCAFTLRYAHLYYRDADREGGIDLPGDEPPDDFDFAYFAFTIAMCFQVSDATISRQQIRRTALGQALLSFVYNTVIVAVVLNLIIGELG